MNNSNSKQNIKNMMCPQRLVTMYCNKLFDTMCYERHSYLGKTPYFIVEQVENKVVLLVTTFQSHQQHKPNLEMVVIVIGTIIGTWIYHRFTWDSLWRIIYFKSHYKIYIKEAKFQTFSRFIIDFQNKWCPKSSNGQNSFKMFSNGT